MIGAFLGSAAGAALPGVLQGLFGSTPSAPDYSGLQRTLQDNYQQQLGYINSLPGQLQPLYQQYQVGNAAAANALQQQTAQNQRQLIEQQSQLFDPNGAAVQSANAALQKQAFAGVPAATDAVRQALAASGGFTRGNAGVQLAQPALQAASNVAQGVANIQSQNLQRQQSAMQDTFNRVGQMSDNQTQQLFGLSKDQTLNLLQYGRGDQINQVQQLLQAGQNVTAGALGIQNAQLQAQFGADAAQSAQQNAMLQGIGGLIGSGISAGAAHLGTTKPAVQSGQYLSGLGGSNYAVQNGLLADPRQFQY